MPEFVRRKCAQNADVLNNQNGADTNTPGHFVPEYFDYQKEPQMFVSE